MTHYAQIVSILVQFCVMNIEWTLSSSVHECPELFFYYENEPFVNAPTRQEPISMVLNHFKLKKPESTQNEAHGLIWDIARHAYDKCCTLSKLKLVQLKDETAISERMFQKSTAANNSNQGIFALLNSLDERYTTDAYFKTIRLLTSPSNTLFL